MAFPKAVLPLAPQYIQSGSYTAQDDRREVGDLMSQGIVNPTDYGVTLVSGLTIQVAPGIGYVPGLNVADQGIYRQRLAAATNLTNDAANATNPRLDQLILRVMDSTADTSGLQEGRLEIATGTPTAGATLDNRSGAADLTALAENSKSVLLLYDILTPAAAGAYVAGNIRDRRIKATPGFGRGGVYRQSITGNTVSGTNAASTIWSYNLDSQLMASGRWIHVVAHWPMENSSGAGVTTVYTFFNATGTIEWQDTTPNIVNTVAGIQRPVTVEIWLPMNAGGSQGTGRITVGSQPATLGSGDIAAAPVVDGNFICGRLNPTAIVSQGLLGMQTTHSSASASFIEQAPVGYVEIF